MPSLLCTLGTSWAVVPEAFLLGNGGDAYSSVTVVTTSSETTRLSLGRVSDWFRAQHPRVRFRGLAIEGLADLMSSDDHTRFEVGLYQAYFEMMRESDNIHVCLAGGFKTMSAAAQEAAGLLGCRSLFHLTVASGSRTDTHEEIMAAVQGGKVHLIGLGSRAGWPTIQELADMAAPLPALGEPLIVEDSALSNAIHHRVQEASRLSANEHELAVLPYPQIARWSPAQRDWLNGALDPLADRAWILSLPKVELHCHLGGFATHGSLLEQVRATAADPNALPQLKDCAPAADWPLTTLPQAPSERLKAYMDLGENTGSALLRNPECLAAHCRLLHEHLVSQNIVYAEIRCSPANYASEGRSPWTVLGEIKAAFDAEMASRPGCRVNLIIIATRRQGGDYRTVIGRHLTLAATAAEHWAESCGCRVVGVDLAGYEDITTRAHYFRDDFHAIHRLGLALTVHAGENDDAEGIWSAIFDLNARRVGHALSLGESKDLLRSVADRRIGIEMCPYANLQIKGFPLDDAVEGSRAAYPLLRYLDAGVCVTVNTDNIGISAASLTDNILLLTRLCPGITRLHILELMRNGIDQSFLSVAGKAALRAIPIPHLGRP